MKKITVVMNVQITSVLTKSDEDAAAFEREKKERIAEAVRRLKKNNELDDARLLKSKVYISDAVEKETDYGEL